MTGFKFCPTAFADQLERLVDRVFSGLDLLREWTNSAEEGKIKI